MKNVLVIIGKLKIGGAERVGFEIGYNADQSKYKIHYVVFGNEIGSYEETLKAKGCVIHHMDSPSSNYLQYYRSLKKLIREEKILVIHSHTMFNSGWAMLAGKKCGVPIRISHSHTIKDTNKRGIVKNSYEKIMRKIILQNATDYVACGTGAGEWLYGVEQFREKGQLIYNGIQLSEYYYRENIRNQIRKELGIEDKFVIGHVGHLASVKNQKYLINILPKILEKKKNTVLLFLGDGTDRESLENMVKEQDLKDFVIFTGNVNNVGEYMSAMDVFAFPSLHEGMPLSLIEAQANGLPCCISDRIPRDVYLTDLIKGLSIDEASKGLWIESLCNAKRTHVERYAELIESKGFETSDMLKKIYDLYER
ncbi:MAG: glycosyltransferase [Eubacterium sp.]|nr:glycosyltransferase [Eubacterium sp.]